MRRIILLLFLGVIMWNYGVDGLCCGKVYDGPTFLKDIDESKSHHRIFASWSGFPGDCVITTTGNTKTGTHTAKPASPSNSHKPTQSLPGASGTARSSTSAFSTGRQKTKGVSYQVAVISERLATSAIQASGYKTNAFTPRCRIGSGIGKVTPDIVPWTYVGENTTYINLKTLLKSGVRYYTIVRAHVEGERSRTVYSNSDGFVPLFHSGADDDDGINDNDSDDDDDGDNDDEGNLNDDGNDGDDDDDDEGLKPYQSGLIAMGVVLFCLLLLCCLLILVGIIAKVGKGEDKYTTTVHRNENVDKL